MAKMWDILYGTKNDKLKININDTTTLVAEIYSYDEKAPNELTIYLEDEYGYVSQDIAIVRQGLVDDDSVQVLVYGDKDDEDYTNAFEIGIWEDTEV